MAFDIPEPIAAYLAAEDAKDADALSGCFSEDGVVHDEGHDHRGHDAIRDWKQAVDVQYKFVLRVIGVEAEGDDVILRAFVTCDFPGSRVELNQIFKLSNNKIASLEIRS